MSDQHELNEAEEMESEDAPQGEHDDTTDWKAMARKHEREAKKNRDAAIELERLKAERMSEAERLQARAEKAERELAELAAEKERAKAAQEVSKETEVPAELLAFCSDREQMEAFAEIYKQSAHVPSAPRKQQTRIVRGSETPVSNRDVFAEMAANIL